MYLRNDVRTWCLVTKRGKERKFKVNETRQWTYVVHLTKYLIQFVASIIQS
jgi:hypothetical protein